MIAALIVVISLAALLQFFISYCRSMLAAYGKVELSEQVREITGLEKEPVTGEEFKRVLQLVHLCPDRGDDVFEIRLVGTYYALLDFVHAMMGWLSPAITGWADHERQSCSYFAAVALDRRIMHSRDLLAQQMPDRI
jgi:hypothetical protein